jgi:nucleotide-binding universal stress UspA family protein
MDAHDVATIPPVIAAFAPGKSSREPVEFGLAASRVTGAPLIVVHVHRGGPLVTWFGGDVSDSMGDEARGLDNLRKDFESNRTKAQIEVIQERTIGGGLLKAIEEHKPQLIVLGSSTRGKVGHVLLSGTAERVIHDATCPVAVVPHGYKRPENGVQLIGAAFSQTPEGREALEAASTMARRGGVKLRAITVLEGDVERQTSGLMAEQHHEGDPAAGADARKRMGAEAALRDAVAELAGDLDTDIDVLAQDPAEALIAASRHVDMLVMGSRARGPKRAVVLGSVSRAVVGGAACPVLVLPRGASEMTRQLAASVQAREPE